MYYETVIDDGQINPASPLHGVTLACYILFGLGLFVPLCTLIGLIVALIKRREADGTAYASHFTWLIRTFWITLAFGLLGMLTALIGIGFLLLGALWIWHIYRVIAGFLKFNDRLAIERPTRWF
ncbi:MULTISPECIES: hypothetical protein [unclassified Paludibacterium]|uniref:DUF4870 family protein n=1 Tax=unclassified Paludibacterium TaxID=2618429 RepID=UPI001C048D32|nr:hypothetical protein [Paludibacterium sp. B53371]BEV71169.1 hypothetical protein THUN1379_06510 [Paludibacterium sp. THUN1379]